MTWGILTVPPQRELKAAADLGRLGCETIVPVEWRPQRISRHARRKRWIKRPLLPRYVLVQLGSGVGWSEVIAEARGRPLLADGRPAGLTDAEVAPLRAADQSGPPSHTPEGHHAQGLRPGQRVRLVTGGAAGSEARVVAVDGDRALIAMDMLGAERVIQVAAMALEAA